MKNNLVIFMIGGSGTGKTTIANEMVSRGICEKAITCTTRKPRIGEKDGIHYHFLKDKSVLDEMYLNNELIESPTEFSGNWYGCPVKSIYKPSADPKPVLAIIEYQGLEKALSVLSKYNDLDILPVFLEPIPMEEVKRRMMERGSTEKEIEERLDTMKEEAHWANSNLFKLRVSQDLTLNEVDSVNRSISTICKSIEQFINISESKTKVF